MAPPSHSSGKGHCGAALSSTTLPPPFLPMFFRSLARLPQYLAPPSSMSKSMPSRTASPRGRDDDLPPR
uniref:Uncharacterized protein n=1 Tax=Arundo donax TaxID=35708 RepID=A0A0A9BQK2_ARUDO